MDSQDSGCNRRGGRMRPNVCRLRDSNLTGVFVSSSVAGTVSPTRQALRRVRRDRSARIGAIIVAALILIAAAAPLLVKLTGQDAYTYHIDLLDPARGNAPRGAIGGVSGSHWFGVEPLTGRDLFSIVVLGLRTS